MNAATFTADSQPPAVFGNPRRDCPRRTLGVAKADAIVVYLDADQMVGGADVDRRAGRPAMLPGISYSFENDLKNLLEYRRAPREICCHFETCLDRERAIFGLRDLLDLRERA